MSEEVPKLYTIEDASRILKLSTKSIRRYVKAGMLENLVIVRRPERNRTLFTDATFSTFLAKYAGNVKPEERPKRAYHRKVTKYARKKKLPTKRIA